MQPDPETHTHNHAIPTTPTTQRPLDMGPGGEGWGPAFLFVSLYKN
jgi:hypothetical protein